MQHLNTLLRVFSQNRKAPISKQNSVGIWNKTFPWTSSQIKDDEDLVSEAASLSVTQNWSWGSQKADENTVLITNSKLTVREYKFQISKTTLIA